MATMTTTEQRKLVLAQHAEQFQKQQKAERDAIKQQDAIVQAIRDALKGSRMAKAVRRMLIQFIESDWPKIVQECKSDEDRMHAFMAWAKDVKNARVLAVIADTATNPVISWCAAAKLAVKLQKEVFFIKRRMNALETHVEEMEEKNKVIFEGLYDQLEAHDDTLGDVVARLKALEDKPAPTLFNVPWSEMP